MDADLVFGQETVGKGKTYSEAVARGDPRRERLVCRVGHHATSTARDVTQQQVERCGTDAPRGVGHQGHDQTRGIAARQNRLASHRRDDEPGEERG
jgi:hypothetical protein